MCLCSSCVAVVAHWGCRCGDGCVVVVVVVIVV